MQGHVHEIDKGQPATSRLDTVGNARRQLTAGGLGVGRGFG